jgi:hypothetical protein
VREAFREDASTHGCAGREQCWPALVGLGFRQRDEQERLGAAGKTDSALGAPGASVGMALKGARWVGGCAEGLLVAERRKP